MDVSLILAKTTLENTHQPVLHITYGASLIASESHTLGGQRQTSPIV